MSDSLLPLLDMDILVRIILSFITIALESQKDRLGLEGLRAREGLRDKCDMLTNSEGKQKSCLIYG
jgi:hypothetical protein